MQEQEIGYISNYFGNISVVIIEMINRTLETGDTVHLKGHTTGFTTTVASMQIEHKQVEKVKKNDSVGLKVSERVRKTNKVYKVIDQ